MSSPRRLSSLERWPSAGSLVVVLGVLSAAPATGQPLNARGPLWAGDEEVGQVNGVDIQVQRWLSPTRLQFALPLGGDDGKAAVLSGVLELGGEGTVILGRVCRDTPLAAQERGVDDFRVEVLADSEVEIVARSARGVAIRVPPPVSTTSEQTRVLPQRVLARACPLRSAARAPSRGELSVLDCEPFTLRSRPDEQLADSFEVTAARQIVSEPGKDGWFRVRYDDFSGFRWFGFSRTAPACTSPPAATPAASGGRMLGGQPEACVRARLPRGAVLRARDGASRLLTVARAFDTTLCRTERAFEWEVEEGDVRVRGYFDGSPLPVP